MDDKQAHCFVNQTIITILRREIPYPEKEGRTGANRQKTPALYNKTLAESRGLPVIICSG